MKRLFNLKVFYTVLSLSLFILLWIIFAPIQVGGQSYYVIINGNSMEPLFHKGDLVVLKSAQQFGVGDIVVYKYPGIGNVIHRIISVSGTHYQIKGDNNSWIDGYSPQKNEIIAKYWFSITGVGTIIGKLKSPWIIAGIVGFITLILGLSMITQKTNSDKQQRNSSNNKISYEIAGWRNGYWWVVYGLGIFAILLGIFAFSKPTTIPAKDMLSYTQNGSFSYGGSGEQDVYTSGGIQTGDPIYTALTCNVIFNFDYALNSELAFSGQGTYSIAGVLKASNGWKKSFILIPETQFSGNAITAQSSFDVCSLQTIIDSVEAATKVESLQYSFEFQPLVKINGQLAGNEFKDSFSPILTFLVDPQQLYLAPYDATTEDPIYPSAEGQVEIDEIAVNTLPILGLKVPVVAARGIAAVAFVLSLLGILIPMFLFTKASKEDKKLQAKMLVGQLLVETQVSPVNGNERIIDLTEFEDLVALSERTGSTLFFHQQALYTDYLVRENNLVYRYRQMISLPEGKERSNIENEISQALKNGEFILFYQPIYSLQDGHVTQVEALLRWQHPTKGLLLASEFLPYTEKTNLICLIDNWVLQKACQQMCEWKESGALNFVLAINISIQQLRDPNLAKNIEDALLENQLSPDSLSIEIPLDQLLFDSVVMNNMKNIRQIGVNLTVKSGNTSAIRKLHQLEGVDQLKISQNLVKEVLTDTSAQNVTRHIIEEAHRNKLGVTAVGIETSEEMGFFRLNDCDGIQGNILSRPMSSIELGKVLKNKAAAGKLD
jgi:signal peptidase I